MFSGTPLLSLLIWLPILGGISVLLIGDKKADLTRWASLAIALVVFALSIPLYTSFDSSTAAMQFQESHSWIAAFNVNYHLGIDGFALPLILLTTFITVIVVIAGWEVIKNKPSQYMAAFLIMEGLMMVCFHL